MEPATKMAPAIGTVLHNRYRLDAELGYGANGMVYRGYDTLLDRAVAIKLLAATGLGTQGRSRLLQEAKMAAKLNHPNVVSVYDAGEAELAPGEVAPFIVMELVEGSSLHDHPPGDLDGVLVVARQVCAALAHAHAHGVIHRDLKPENIILATDGSAKLSDFGLALSISARLSDDGSITGTVFYLAPELARGGAADARTDLYALGVMLYELATGRLPFSADDPLAVISQHLYAPPVPPRAHRPEIPPAVEALILSLMRKEPDDRPQSAEVVGSVLDRLEGAATAAEARAPGLERIARGRLAGRAGELAQAQELWRKALAGEGQVLLVSGEPGIGKTRFVRELMALVEVMGGRSLAAECYADVGAPYAPIAPLTGDLARAVGDDLQRLPPFVLGDLLTLAPGADVPRPDGPPVTLPDPIARQSRLYESFVTLCSAAAARQPLLLFVDDVHWADSGTLFLLRHLARRGRRLRLLLALAYRDISLDPACCLEDVLHDLNRERLSTRVNLRRLGLAETGALLAGLLDDEVAPELTETIYRDTEGNPFFAEEVVKGLLEEQSLALADGCWRLSKTNGMQIPQTVRLAIQARVGKLPDATQEVLQTAAVLGREFEFETLQRAATIDEDSLIAALEIAKRAQLIGEVPARQREQGTFFAFTNTVIPATLRENLGSLRRPRLHRRAAVAIAALHADDYEALAYHWSEARNREQARAAYAQAGDRALARYANQEAERHYRAALGSSRPDPDCGPLLGQLGEALFGASRLEEAIATWNEAIELCRAAGDRDRVAYLYGRSTRTAWLAGDNARCLALARQGLAAAGECADGRGMATLLHEAGRACFFNGLAPEAEDLCRQASDMAERLNLTEARAETTITLGLLALRRRDYDAAQAAYLQAIAMAEPAGLLLTAARAEYNLASLLDRELADEQQVRARHVRAVELAHQAGAASAELLYRSTICHINLAQGSLTEVERELPRLRQLLAQAGSRESSTAQVQLAELMLQRRRGELEEPASRLGELLARSRQRDDLQMVAVYGAALGDVLSELGRWEEAEQALAEATAASDRMSIDIDAPCRFAILHAQRGRVDEGRRLLEAARLQAGDQPRGGERMWLRWAEAQLLAAEGNWGKALAVYQELAVIIEGAGARWYLARLLVEWAEAQFVRSGPGDRRQAIQLLRRAEALFAAMPAPSYVDAVRGQLEQLEALAR